MKVWSWQNNLWNIRLWYKIQKIKEEPLTHTGFMLSLVTSWTLSVYYTAQAAEPTIYHTVFSTSWAVAGQMIHTFLPSHGCMLGFSSVYGMKGVAILSKPMLLHFLCLLSIFFLVFCFVKWYSVDTAFWYFSRLVLSELPLWFVICH